MTGAPSPAPWGAWLQDSLRDLHARDLFRELKPVYTGSSSVKVTAGFVEGGNGAAPAGSRPEELTLFSLSDYLGLSDHPAVRAAAAAVAARHGNGPRSSALVSGHTEWHGGLEDALADLKGTEACLLLPSGFQANLAVSAAIGGPGSVIFSDSLNHASIVDGTRLAAKGGARLILWRHNDLAHLRELLLADIEDEGRKRRAAAEAGGEGREGRAAASLPPRRRVVVTESLFSMDGDFADLPGLARLKREIPFLLVVDEAHASLACGEHGGGAAEMAGPAAHGAIDLHVGTLSKAVGAAGGFVACSHEWRALISNKGRSHVFSTALPLPTVESAREAVAVSRREPWRRAALWGHAARIGRALDRPAESYIIPIVLGTEARALEAAAFCRRRGLVVPAIRPPTVPRGTARLRISLSSAHSHEDVTALLRALADLGLTRGSRDGVARALSRSADAGRAGPVWAPVDVEAGEDGDEDEAARAPAAPLGRLTLDAAISSGGAPPMAVASTNDSKL